MTSFFKASEEVPDMYFMSWSLLRIKILLASNRRL